MAAAVTVVIGNVDATASTVVISSICTRNSKEILFWHSLPTFPFYRSLFFLFLLMYVP